MVAMSYPGASIVLARQTLNSVYSTVLASFIDNVLGPNESKWPCERYGGNKPEWFKYYNGTTLWIVGMDKPSKQLSAEHDYVYCNQVEEFSKDGWEIWLTRTTGRAGHIPFPQCLGDCNPTYPTHWIYARPSCKIFRSTHRDNPMLFDQETGEMTPQGQRTLQILSGLTGVRRKRLYEGIDAMPEGIVYEAYDPDAHMLDRLPLLITRYVAAIDFGYTAPGVLQIWGITATGAMILVREFYQTKRLLEWWVAKCLAAMAAYNIEAIICDPSRPDYIDKLKAAGIPAYPGFNSIAIGIDAVITRFKDSRLLFYRSSCDTPDARLIVDHKAYRTVDELPIYTWDRQSGLPIDANNHGMDAMRYAVCYVDDVRASQVVRRVNVFRKHRDKKTRERQEVAQKIVAAGQQARLRSLH